MLEPVWCPYYSFCLPKMMFLAAVGDCHFQANNDFLKKKKGLKATNRFFYYFVDKSQHIWQKNRFKKKKFFFNFFYHLWGFRPPPWGVVSQVRRWISKIASVIPFVFSLGGLRPNFIKIGWRVWSLGGGAPRFFPSSLYNKASSVVSAKIISLFDQTNDIAKIYQNYAKIC